MTFYIRKTRIEIDFWFLALITAAIMMSVDVATLMLAILAHELGHFVGMRIYNRPLVEIKLSCMGAKMIKDSFIPNYKEELIILILGPLFGVITAMVAKSTGYDYYAGISLFLSVFNLLPLENLDGGAMLHAIKNSTKQ